MSTSTLTGMSIPCDSMWVASASLAAPITSDVFHSVLSRSNVITRISLSIVFIGCWVVVEDVRSVPPFISIISLRISFSLLFVGIVCLYLEFLYVGVEGDGAGAIG